MNRPMPPLNLGVFTDEGGWPVVFAPDLGLTDWVRSTFIAVDGQLANEDHSHLRDASSQRAEEGRVMNRSHLYDLMEQNGKSPWNPSRKASARVPEPHLDAPTMCRYDDATVEIQHHHDIYGRVHAQDVVDRVAVSVVTATEVVDGCGQHLMHMLCQQATYKAHSTRLIVGERGQPLMEHMLVDRCAKAREAAGIEKGKGRHCFSQTEG